MDLGLDSVLEEEIQRQTRSIENTEAANEIVNENENQNNTDRIDNKINSETDHIDKEEPIQAEKDYTWIRDIIDKENKKYDDLTIDLKDITGKNIYESTLPMKCNLYIHKILQQWEEEIERQKSYISDDTTAKGGINKTTQERNELFYDTKMSLFPLLVQLRKKTLPRNQLVSVSTILFHLQRHEWDLSLQSYMQLSIGNVAWPIGVTSVGIHARSAHSKITGDRKHSYNTTDQINVANIMIDDSTRKWTTALKRLITISKNITIANTQKL